MPTYPYACTACGHAFEVQQSFSDPSLTECPECSGKLRKVFSSVGVVFKGSGFYRTDSRSGAATGSKAGKGAGSTSDGGSGSTPSGDGASSSATTSGSGSSGSGSSGSASSGSGSSSSGSGAAKPAASTAPAAGS